MNIPQNIMDNEVVYRDYLMEWIIGAALSLNIDGSAREVWDWCHGLIDKPSDELLGMDDLKRIIGTLYYRSIIPHKIKFGVSGGGRPTEDQRLAFFRLACMADFIDPDSKEFRDFIKSVAKVDSPNFLTRAGIITVIRALRKEIERKAEIKAAAAKRNPA